MSGYSVGYLAGYFDVWTHYLIAFIVSAIVAQLESLTFCFVKKHQTIANITKEHVVPERLHNFLAFCLPFAPLTFFFSFCEAGMKREEQMDYIRQKYPQHYSGFSSILNFAIYELNSWFLFVIIMAFCGGITCALVFTLSTIDMFRMLRKVRKKISILNFRRHRSTVKSLLAQFAASSLLLVPLFCFVIVIMLEVDNAQIIIQITLAVFSLRSSVNAVVLIFTTPPFRNFVLRPNLKKANENFQVICMITDINFHFLIQPVPLFPIVAKYCVGVLATTFKIYTHYLVVVLSTSQAIQTMWLIICFVRKHQALAIVIRKHVAPKSVLILGFMKFATILLVWTVTLTLSGMSKEKQMDYVRVNYPQHINDFSHLPNFAIYEFNIYIKVDLAVASFGGLFGVVIFFTTTFDMFRILNQVKKKVSEVSYKCYQSALYSSHSTVNALVLIATTPSFRRCFCRKKIKNQLPAANVSSC
ncbi:unnamed protein product [Caenorhabditis brenneri]